MLNSGIIDLAIGLAFIFGATAALASVITEMIARFLGLRGAYLLAGLRELVDSAGKSVLLDNAAADVQNARNIATGAAGAHATGEHAPDATGEHAAGAPLPSATHVLLSSPMLGSQGVVGTIATKGLTVEGAKPKVKASSTGKTDPIRLLRTETAVLHFGPFVRHCGHGPGGTECVRADHHGRHPGAHQEHARRARTAEGLAAVDGRERER
jgi:hypothetical protein